MNWIKKNSLWIVVAGLLAGFLVVVLRTAWVSDDAYITFRSVENFIHGYGPVYNIGERVQAFTHPLWFFIQSGANAITQRIGALNAWAQMYYVSLLLSIGFSLAAVLVLVIGIARSAKGALLALIALILSKAFIDYTTSGLENALTYFLLAVFLHLYFREMREETKVFWIALVAALGGLNRLDTVLFFLPALVYLLWKSQKRSKMLLLTVLGFVPLLLWELFSLFYYGFPFPNTAYAKLNTGIPQVDLAVQGFKYYLSSTRLDPLMMVVILGSLVWFFWKGSRQNYPILVGVVLYLLYMFYTGGDFMAGRFFSGVYFVCVALLAREEYVDSRVYAGVVASILVIGLINPLTPPRTSLSYGLVDDIQTHIDENGVADERAYYYPRMGLFSEVRSKAPPGSNFSGNKWYLDPEKPIKFVETGPLGAFGYMVGPNRHVVDYNALSDPLMVRMPIIDREHWRIGHFKHVIPDGYLETLRTGVNQIVDPGVAEYYKALVLVTRGDLLDPQRLVEIWKLNTGQYNHLIESYSPEVP